METEKMRIELNQEEVQLLDELNVLQAKMGEYDPEEMNRKMLDELKKSAIDSIAAALDFSDVLDPDGRQYASNLKDLEHRKEMSAAEFRNTQSFKNKYNAVKKTVCEKAGKKKGIINGEKRRISYECFTDYHTGRELVAGDKYKEGDSYQFDHVGSVGEFKDDKLLGFFLSNEELENFINSEENIAATDSYLNNVKDKKSWQEWENWWDEECKEDKSKTNAEYYGIDKERARARYKEAKAAYNKVVAKAALNQGKNIAKQTAGYAIKMTVFKFVKIVVAEIIDEYKLKSEKSISKRMKQVGERICFRMSELIDTFKESAFANMISTLMDIILNFFKNITKRAFKIIRKIISPILNVFKTLFDKSKPIEERTKAALKILGTALIGVISVLLDEVINKALLTIPIFVPFVNDISPVLSTLIIGIGGVLILQLFAKHQADVEYCKLTQKASAIKNKLDRFKIVDSGISNMEVVEAVNTSIAIFGNTCYIASACEKDIENNLSNVHAGSLERKTILEETNSNLNDIDNLLTQMNNITFSHE